MQRMAGYHLLMKLQENGEGTGPSGVVTRVVMCDTSLREKKTSIELRDRMGNWSYCEEADHEENKDCVKK